MTIIDGRNIEKTNISHEDVNSPLVLSHVTLHVLSPGCGYNFHTRDVNMEKEVKG